MRLIKWHIHHLDYAWDKSVSMANGVLAGIGWMTVGSTFIVAGGHGIGSMAVGSTFIVGGNGVGNMAIGSTFTVG